jgi:hypothetical protein
MQMRQNPQPVKIFRLGENINSVYFDGAPLRYADKLYFTSARPEGKTSRGLSRLYTSIQQGPSRLHEINPSQAEVQAGQIALTPDAGRLYYTLCRDGEDGKTLCEIYYRERTYEGDWQAPKKLPGHVNLKGYTSTQPTTGRDRTLGKDVLFFSSDRPGGKGGMDIWCSVVERNGEFGEPFPLPFNTAGDEVTPFFHMQSQTLFFSSNGLQSFGGFDIFKINRTGKESWSEPGNMGWPLNSSRDELYYTYHTGSDRAYFASNRPGVLCADPEKGCRETDIFEAQRSEKISCRFSDLLEYFITNIFYFETTKRSDAITKPSSMYCKKYTPAAHSHTGMMKVASACLLWKDFISFPSESRIRKLASFTGRGVRR